MSDALLCTVLLLPVISVCIFACLFEALCTDDRTLAVDEFITNTNLNSAALSTHGPIAGPGTGSVVGGTHASPVRPSRRGLKPLEKGT